MTKYQRLCYDTAVQLEKKHPDAFQGDDTGIEDMGEWRRLLGVEWVVRGVIARAFKVKP